MSVIEEDLLAPRITKRSAIKVIVVASLLISLFVFSTVIYALILGSQRRDPSERLEDAEQENPLLVLPPIPDDWLDYLESLDINDLDLDDLDALEDLGINMTDIDLDDLDTLADLVDNETINEFLEEMNDGDIDNYDLSEAGLVTAGILLLMSEVEVFRVYDYYYNNNLSEREDILWKYECFDQYNGNGWYSTVPRLDENDFPTYNEYISTYSSYLEKNLIKRQLQTNQGLNSFVLGNLFPSGVIYPNQIPYIIEETISANNLDHDPGLSNLYKDELGCVIADLTFTSTENVSFYYELFGLGLNPKSNEEINNTAVRAEYTPQVIENQFLQLPQNYKSNNPSFNSHWNVLNTIINPSDTAFTVANKIRNYLQDNFELSFNELLDDPPGDEEDIVEWFCEKEEGMYSEWASAFCVFTRSFGVASRFVDGYNSRLITEFPDPDEGKDTYPIKYKNLYNWAEIYVPYDTTQLLSPAHGEWVQMDGLYDSFGGGNPISIENYNITVTSNATQPFLTYNRGDTAKITAVLDSTESPIDGRTITFTDESTGVILGSNITINGITSIEVNVGDNHVVGPNVIRAEDQGGSGNFTVYIVEDAIKVVVQQITDQEVNISKPNPTTRVIGYVQDPSSGRRVANAEVNFLLLYKGTNTPLPFNPFDTMNTITGSNGAFDEILQVQGYVPYGEYDFRVDFNGTWSVLGFPFVYPPITNSSDLFDFNVTKEITYDLLFSINDRPTEYPFDPDPGTLVNIKRGEQLNLSVIVLDSIDKTPESDVNVNFYDYTNGDILIGSDITDPNGNASILYDIGITHISGPSLVYATVGGVENYSYYILNEYVEIGLTSGPVPRQVNITLGSSDPFNVVGYVEDDKGNRVGYTEITLRLFDKNGNPYPGYLLPIGNSNPYFTGSDGSFNLNFEVDQNTPVGNYSLRMDFNGTIDFFRDINNPYKYTFDINFLSNSSVFQHDLKVFDPELVEILFYVENNPVEIPYSESNRPQSYTLGEFALFNVTVTQSGGDPLAGTTVEIIDVYDNNRVLDSYPFPGSIRDVQFNISTDNFYFAGIHKIRAKFENSPPNTTYIVINESVKVHANSIILTPRMDNVVQRNLEGFTVSGYVWDNNTGLKGLRVRLLLFNETHDNVSHYLIGNPFALTDSNGNFTININSIDINCPQGLYYIRVDFNGSINILDEAPIISLITNYMIHSSSSPVYLNITAATYFIEGGYHTSKYEDDYPNYWVNGTTLYVYGNLYWDNNSGIINVIVNISIIKISDNSLIAYNDTVSTISNGAFNGTILIGDDWPLYRSETRIIVTFTPINSFSFPDYLYIEESSIEFT